MNVRGSPLAASAGVNSPRGIHVTMSQVDPRAPRFNQGVVGAGALLSFLLDTPLVLPALALALAAGALLGPNANPLALLWRRVVVPGLRLGPPKAAKDAAPVRFAQSVGSALLVAASALVLSGLAPSWGWALALVVAALALLAAITDVCVGCGIYVLVKRWAPRPSRS